MIPTGRQIPLEHGDYRAVVTEVGASPAGVDLAGPAAGRSVSGQEELPVAYQGAVLAPWPNRIADGRYRLRRDIATSWH